MDKQNIYVTFINALLGVGLSMLLNGALMIGVIACLLVITILWIERKRIHESIFRGKKLFTITGYVTTLALMAGLLFFLAKPNRDISMIVQNVNVYLSHLKPDEYNQSYQLLSQLSKADYPEKNFVEDHAAAKIMAKDYRIHKVELNEFDKNKASVTISSPFFLYGKESLTLNMVKEGETWNIVFSPITYELKKSEIRRFVKASANADKKKKEPGKVSKFFRKIF